MRLINVSNLFALLLMAFAAGMSQAQTAKEDDSLDLLEQENHVFSASRYVQTIAETPANVKVLTREDIKRFGYRSINDTLASLPGLYDAASQWPVPGVRGLAAPGDFGSRILYLINGMMGGLETGMNRELGGGAMATARAYAFKVSEKGDYPYTFSGSRVPPADYINVTDLASLQYGVELRYDRFFSNNHHPLAGAEVKHVTTYQQVGDQPGPVRSGVPAIDASPGYGQWAVFAQDEMPLGPGKLFLGGRLDDYRGFSEGVKSRLSPRIAYVQDSKNCNRWSGCRPMGGSFRCS